MKIAVLSDIHSNWQALEAVVADMPEVDAIICLGDVVGYGGDPIRCLDYVRDKRWPTLVGNHDRACTDVDILDWFNEDAAKAIEWTVAHLGKDRLKWLRGAARAREPPRPHLRVHPRQPHGRGQPRHDRRAGVLPRPHPRSGHLPAPQWPAGPRVRRRHLRSKGARARQPRLGRPASRWQPRRQLRHLGPARQ
ncbi:MAG: metallophosphoesterase [Chloroflexi bacterium]|nr:MAG: metallophosphoesterase [Chloroflexota bacterium]